jgi:hypothetical protein
VTDLEIKRLPAIEKWQNKASGIYAALFLVGSFISFIAGVIVAIYF